VVEAENGGSDDARRTNRTFAIQLDHQVLDEA
jgi:hypothetical protein